MERIGVVGLDLDVVELVYRLWIVGPEIGLLLGWSAGSGCGTSLQKQKEDGSVGASPVAAPMLKLVPL